ncbi:hypothetical protein [Nonomuraea dietziae]|uniref:hypothetical protein n=1 Tax=Nonomuraea dietziae TaxID=65515 RepID=UPI0033DB3854
MGNETADPPRRPASRMTTRALRLFAKKTVTYIGVVLVSATIVSALLRVQWPDPLHPIVILTGAVFVAPAAIAMAIDWLRRNSDRQRLDQAAEDPGELLQRRVERVNTAFAEAAALMDELQRDVEAQQAAREALVTQAAEQQRLLEINEEQAEKIRHLLFSETKATIHAERRQQWTFFLLGYLASTATSIPIGIWINSIS